MDGHYPSDLSDRQWQLIRPLLPARAKRGRPPINRREIINAILYVVRTGCQWRQLPLDFPTWKTVYTVFRRWRIKRAVGANSRLPAAPTAAQRWQTQYAHGDDHRQPVGADGRRRRRTRLRCRQKDHGPQADAIASNLSPIEGRVCRQRLRSQRTAGLGANHVRLGFTNRAAARAGQGIRGVAQALDRRTHVCLDRPSSSPRPRLRTQPGNQRGPHLPRHDRHHVTPNGSTRLI